MPSPFGARWFQRLILAATTLSLQLPPAHSQSPANNPQPKTSFAKVAGKLDQNGSFYLIWDVGRSIRRTVESVADLAIASGDPQARMGIPVLRSTLKELGLWDLGYLGVSHHDPTPGSHRCVLFLEVPERKGLLNLQGEPRNLDLLAIFPPETLLLSATAFEFSRLIPLAEDVAGGVAGMVGRQSIKDGLDNQKEKNGVDLQELLSGLGNEIALGFWLDPREKISIPGPKDKTLEFPRPRLAIAVNATTNTLLHLAHRESQRKDDGSHLTSFDKWETLVGPGTPKVPHLHPVLAWKPGMLVFTESTTTLRILESTRQSGKDVRTSPDWKALNQAMPARSLKVLYLSPASSRAALETLNQIPATNRQERTARQMISKIISWLGGGMMAVTTYEDGGFLHISLTSPPPPKPSAN